VFVEGLLPINALEDAAGTRVVFRETRSRDGGGARRRRAEGARLDRGVGAVRKPKELAWHLGDRVHVRAETYRSDEAGGVEFAIAEVA